MRTVVMRRVGVPILLIGLAACTEPSAPIPVETFRPAAAAAGNCELASAISSEGRKYFDRTDESELRRLTDLIDEGCRGGDQTVIASAAWDLVGRVEGASAAARGEDLTAGSSLLNLLLACTVGPCRSADLPGIDFVAPLGPYGILALRRADAVPAIAHGWVPFTDASGNANTALWGVEVDQPWSVVTATNPVLVYGGPGGSLALKEVEFGDVQYSLDVFPDLGTFLDGALHVGACFSQEIAVPHLDGDHGKPSLQPRMQREGVLLSSYSPTFCPPPPSSASMFGSIAKVLAPLVPAAVRDFLRTDTKIRLVGGTPLDFSQFAPVGANPLGSIALLSGPITPISVGQSLGPIHLQVSAGGTTLMERVLVTVKILNNKGVPAGAILSGQLSAYTSEVDGQQGIAILNGIRVGKAGGYSLCFSAEDAGFVFPPVCKAVTVRNR